MTRSSAVGPPDSQRIVVTGLGIVSPLGCGVGRVWPRLLAGQSGIRQLPDDIVSDVPSKVAGIVPSLAEDPDAGFTVEGVVPRKDQRKMDRFIQLAMVVAEEALTHAGWHPEDEHARERTATVVASGLGGVPAIVEAGATVAASGVRALSPFTIPSFLINLAAGQISIRYGFLGPLGAPATACAAGIQAIGDAARLLRAGEAEIALAGGSESTIERMTLGAFAASRALSTGFNDEPERASRPFDRDRDGFVMGEGAAMLILETLAHARGRAAAPLAEIVGYGTAADAYHITASPADGAGAQRAMRAAIAQAGLLPSDIDYLSAHATSTPLGDANELVAIEAIFGDAPVAISATKSATGHLCGAAGAMAALFTVMALRDGVLPPTLNLDHPDPAAVGLDLVGPQARVQPIEVGLVNGFGFGGVNASLVLRRWS